MRRLIFGVRCSLYVATQVLRHHAETHTESHPLASKAITETHTESHPLASKAITSAFYVDDYLSGALTVEAVQIRTELCDLLKTAGMTLRKWRSSSNTFITTIPSNIVETENLLIAPTDKPIKALGLYWDVTSDNFTIATPLSHSQATHHQKEYSL